jgi:hypothetical protein
MRFKRSDTVPPAPSRTPDVELLLGQIGLFVHLNAELEARAERAEALLAGAAEEHADLLPLLRQLGRVAGEVPGVVAQAGELQAENTALARRAAEGDRDLGLLTTALIGDLEPRAFETETDNPE